MKVVYNSFDGRYSDNPRVLYEKLRNRFGTAEHIWMLDPAHAHGFPTDTVVVPIGSAACIDALESADLVVANTHIDLDWVKAPGTTYLQTWHGTPLKRIHYDVLWAPPGRLAALDLDVARWDYLLSPNSASTPRLRAAFGFTGDVLEAGYPRMDILTSRQRARVRARVRAALGLADDVTAVLYTPTWRDDQFFAPGAPRIELALDAAAFAAELGPKYCLLPRLHYRVTDRGVPLDWPGVKDVSYYPDAQELYLAADVMVTDYSSTMFDFAVTGKPMLFYTYDLDNYRDALRGFYFDFEPIAPGPMVTTAEELLAGLRDLPGIRRSYAGRYADFQRTFCHLADGHATERLSWLYRETATRARTRRPGTEEPRAAVPAH